MNNLLKVFLDILVLIYKTLEEDTESVETRREIKRIL